MGAGNGQGFGGFGAVGRDCFDSVRRAIVRAQGARGASIADTDLNADDLARLAERLDRVHALSDRFSGVELSPYVENLLEKAELHRVAV